MCLSEKVHQLEINYRSSRGLASEILATLIVNIEKGNLTFSHEETEGLYMNMIEKWKQWHQKLPT